MNRVFLIFVFYCLAFAGFSQGKFLPTVILFYPNEIKEDSLSSIELKAFQITGTVTEQMRKEFIREGLAPNWRIIREKELVLMNEQEFYGNLILSITRQLTYLEIENRSNLLIYPEKRKLSGGLVNYKKIADEYRVSWVVNINKTEAVALQGKRLLNVTLQLYNVVTNRIYLDKSYSVDSSEVVFSDTCQDVWSCMAESIQHAIVTDLADKIEKNIRHERQ
jgi:hypothetical protein